MTGGAGRTSGSESPGTHAAGNAEVFLHRLGSGSLIWPVRAWRIERAAPQFRYQLPMVEQQPVSAARFFSARRSGFIYGETCRIPEDDFSTGTDYPAGE